MITYDNLVVDLERTTSVLCQDAAAAITELQRRNTYLWIELEKGNQHRKSSNERQSEMFAKFREELGLPKSQIDEENE